MQLYADASAAMHLVFLQRVLGTELWASKASPEASHAEPAGESLRKDAEELVKQSGMRLEIRLQGLPLGFASFCLCLGERDDGGYVSGSLSWFWGFFGGQQDLPEDCQNDAGDPAEFCFPDILQTSEMRVCVRNTTGRKKPLRDLIRDLNGRL